MKDPTRPPGYQFQNLRVKRALIEFLVEPRGEATGELNVGYSDQVNVDGLSVSVIQTVTVQVLDPSDSRVVYLRAVVSLEGIFLGSADANIDPNDFGNDYAPSILFAFSREWIHKLTSACQPWPPVLLPPINVHQVRKQARTAEKARDPKVRPARKARH
jgi:preprotein translocase subunit SecB